jgi:hypothetical protein
LPKLFLKDLIGSSDRFDRLQFLKNEETASCLLQTKNSRRVAFDAMRSAASGSGPGYDVYIKV